MIRLFPALFATLVLLLSASLQVQAQTLPRIDVAKLPPHPRLLLTDKAIQNALDVAKTDPLRAQLNKRIIAIAIDLISEPTAQYRFIGPRMLSQSRRAIKTVLTCAAAYRLTGETAFSDRAIKEMLAAADFPDWNPDHFLDVAEMSMALALGYDWLYPELSVQDRATIRKTLVEKSLVFAKAAYAPGGPTDRRLWFASAHHNWNQVCNGGLLAAALSIAEDEPELARSVVNGMCTNITGSMAAYQPDGGYPEGPSYWLYGTSYNILAIAMLENVFGTDFGLSQADGFDHTDFYRLYAASPSGLAFNYADGSSNVLTTSPFYAMLALRYHHAFELADCRRLLAANLQSNSFASDRFLALHLLWFPPAQDAVPPEPPLDAHFRGGADIAVFRSAWNNPNALFIGFKAGYDQVNHAHMDLGSFVLDSDGVRWAADLGSDDYNLPDYPVMKQDSPRWGYFRLSNLSHNTIIPANLPQKVPSTAPIISFQSTPNRAFAIADLTPVYPSAAISLKRGIALLDRDRVLVQDEATGLKPGTPLRWTMATGATIKLDADGHGATLSQAGQTLRVQVLSPTEGAFSIRPGQPPPGREAHNDGISLLTYDCTPKSSDAVIAILLVPTGPHWPALTGKDTVIPLAQWDGGKK
ncbi:MAG TPA: heparinase II/III family protein [Opitutaceae bacterium]|nr:heparinase II/III family protein [Opitutaceae bacterium]